MTGERLTGADWLVDQQDAGEPDGQALEVLRLFDAQAVTWPAKYAQDGSLVRRLASLSAAVGWYAQAGDCVLDLGCGTRELARLLTDAGLRVTGCDISRQMLLRAARGPRGRARWVRLEPGWRRLPFASAVFDVVVAASVLEYVADPAAVLRECARVVRPGASSYIRSPICGTVSGGWSGLHKGRPG
jgi:SAM-dependent methyltransferase